MGFTRDTPGPLTFVSNPSLGGDADAGEEAGFFRWLLSVVLEEKFLLLYLFLLSQVIPADCSLISNTNLEDFLDKAEAVNPIPA